MANTNVMRTIIEPGQVDQSSDLIIREFQQEGCVFLPGFFNQDNCEEIHDHYEKNVKYSDKFFYRIKSNKREKNLFTSSGYVVNPLMNLHLDEDQKVAAPFNRFLHARQVNNLMESIFGGACKLHKSMYFESNRGTERHFDTDIFGTGNRMIGLWIALETITEENGGFFYYPRTNQLWAEDYPDLQVKAKFNQYRTFSSLKKEGYSNEDRSALLSIYKQGNQCLSEVITDMGSTQVSHSYQPGDAVLFDAMLLHGSYRPKNYQRSRNSISAHFTQI